MSAPRKIALVVGEHSGDQLGFKLMRALRARLPEGVSFSGMAGPRMEAEGMTSLFPLRDVAVMGITAVLPRLPRIIRRVHETVAAIVADPPDALVIIDSPDFTHAVAKRVRQRLPHLPIIDYVSPSVWAWRPGRARRMRAYVDHVLALLPFEPAAHARLGGPPCSYVGHPLIERLDELRPGAQEEAARQGERQVLVMPGSRRVTLHRLLDIFRETLIETRKRVGEFNAVIPAVDHLADEIETAVKAWPFPVEVVRGEEQKYAAFRRARAALVCSGTATLELALSGVPMAVAYRVSALESCLLPLLRVQSIVLPNLILGENAIPEFIHHKATPQHLAPALTELIIDSPVRDKQISALQELDARMTLDGGETPSDRAARIILETIHKKRDAAF